MIRFYRNDTPEQLPPHEPLPQGLELKIWMPGRDGPARPRSLAQIANPTWWAFERSGFFSRRGFTEITIWDARQLLHRLIVTPRWRRFPFMAAEDLQIGDLWTSPAARRRGLAKTAIVAAHRHFGSAAPRFWYLTDERNTPSVRLIESCGYVLAGTGVRTRRFGLRAFGRFQLGVLTANDVDGADRA